VYALFGDTYHAAKLLHTC